MADSDDNNIEGSLHKLVSAIINKKMKKKPTRRWEESNRRPRGGHATKIRQTREKQVTGGIEESEVDESEIELSSDHHEDGTLKAQVLAQASQSTLSQQQRHYVRDINVSLHIHIICLN